MNVDLRVGDIVVTAEDNVGPVLSEVINVKIYLVQPFVFERLPQVAGCSRGKVCVYQSNVSKIQLEDTPFFIAYFMAIAVYYVVGLKPREYCYAAVSFFLCR